MSDKIIGFLNKAWELVSYQDTKNEFNRSIPNKMQREEGAAEAKEIENKFVNILLTFTAD